MARKLDDVMAALPKARRERIEARTMELATLKDLRQAAQQGNVVASHLHIFAGKS